MSAQRQLIGFWLQLSGAAAFAAGVVLSFHHYAIAACFLGGAAAFLLGRKFRAA